MEEKFETIDNFCSYVCNCACSNDWYCPKECDLLEKALELACKEITGSCEYCSYKTRIECPVEADCLNEKINYFKTKAKEIINGYKQDD